MAKGITIQITGDGAGAVEGDRDERLTGRRERAGWVSLLLSAQCGKPITAEQLLGEEPADGDIEARAEKYQRELEKRLKRENGRKLKAETDA